MKKLLYLLALTFFISATYAQDHDPRLLEGYTQTELDKMKADQPEQYSFLLAALDKAIFIGPIPTQKGKDVKFDGELDIDPSEDHTFLSLGIELKENTYQYFKVTGTDQMVGVLPKSLIKK